MQESNYVYLHTRQDDNIVFYVGIGVANRAWAKGDRNPHWHRTVKKHGYTVALVQENLTKQQAAQKEIELIAMYRELSGSKLTNMTAGGDGGMTGYNHTEEAKKKIGEASKGNKYAVGNTSFKGKTHSEEARKKIKEKRALQGSTRKGVPHSEETKALIRKKRAKQVMTEETKQKIRESLKGRKKSPDHIAKIAAANKGKARSEEALLNMKEAQQKNKSWLGRSHSEATKQKMRDSALKRKLLQELGSALVP